MQPHVVLVQTPPVIRIEDGLVIMERPDYWRAMSPHVAEATARSVLAALAEWRERENVVAFR